MSPFVPSPLNVQPTITAQTRTCTRRQTALVFIDDLRRCEVRNVGPSLESPGPGKLEADVIDGARVCLEKVNIWAQGGRSLKVMFAEWSSLAERPVLPNFGCSRSTKGLARGTGRGIDGRIVACRPVVVCINDEVQRHTEQQLEQ
jgi:hypothetical protein